MTLQKQIMNQFINGLMAPILNISGRAMAPEMSKCFSFFQLVQTAKTTAAIIVFKISVGVIVGRDSCSVKDINDLEI